MAKVSNPFYHTEFTTVPQPDEIEARMLAQADAMTTEEIEKELQESGIDVDAFLSRCNKTLEECYRKAMTKPTRGGSRAGAGRKPDPNAKVSTTIRLSRDIKEYLATTEDATATIETTIRNSKAYKQWRRK